MKTFVQYSLQYAHLFNTFFAYIVHMHFQGLVDVVHRDKVKVTKEHIMCTGVVESDIPQIVDRMQILK